TGTYDAMAANQILTGVYFNAPGTLTPVSATAIVGTVYYFPSTTNVGGEWAYSGSVAGGPGTGTKGISASGMGDFGAANFGTTNLQGNANLAVQGVDFGIAPAGDNSATGNGSLMGNPNVTGDENALIRNSVTFVLSGWSGSLASIT